MRTDLVEAIIGSLFLAIGLTAATAVSALGLDQSVVQVEASRPGTDEFFGDAELDRVVSRLAQSADVVQELLKAHRRWIGAESPLADDVTVLVVKRT